MQKGEQQFPLRSINQVNAIRQQYQKQELLDISEITKHIFIGDRNISLNKKQLQRLSIKRIVVCGCDLEQRFPEDFKYLKIDLKDSVKADLLSHLEKTNQFIEEAVKNKENILIHCAFGVSRSSAVAIAYFIHRFKMTFEEAHHFIKKRRPQIKPNEGFRLQLAKFAENCQPKK